MPFGPQPIADDSISFEEYEKSGCPVCKTGEKEGYVIVRTHKESLFVCAHCNIAYAVRTTGAA